SAGPVRPAWSSRRTPGASVDHVAVDDHLLLRLAVDLARGAHGDEAEAVTLAGQLRVRSTSQGATEPTVLVRTFLVRDGLSREAQPGLAPVVAHHLAGRAV